MNVLPDPIGDVVRARGGLVGAFGEGGADFAWVHRSVLTIRKVRVFWGDRRDEWEKSLDHLIPYVLRCWRIGEGGYSGIYPSHYSSFSTPHVSDVGVFEVGGPGLSLRDRDGMEVCVFG